MKLTLVNKFATMTSRGVLSKAWYRGEDDKLYLVKGNSKEDRVIGYEPFSEVIAYRIGRVLELDCMPYGLVKSKYAPDVKLFGELEYASICEMQELTQRISFYEYMVALGKQYTDPCHVYLSSNLDKSYLARLLAFDAFIGNRDRHLGNFDVHIRNGVFYNAPVYDNGASLLAWESSSYVKSIKRGTKIYSDQAKPFKDTHREQIKLALRLNDNQPIFGISNKDDFYARIFKECEDVFSVMPEYRAEGIKNYLLNRHIYLV